MSFVKSIGLDSGRTVESPLVTKTSSAKVKRDQCWQDLLPLLFCPLTLIDQSVFSPDITLLPRRRYPVYRSTEATWNNII